MGRDPRFKGTDPSVPWTTRFRTQFLTVIAHNCTENRTDVINYENVRAQDPYLRVRGIRRYGVQSQGYPILEIVGS